MHALAVGRNMLWRSSILRSVYRLATSSSPLREVSSSTGLKRCSNVSHIKVTYPINRRFTSQQALRPSTSSGKPQTQAEESPQDDNAKVQARSICKHAHIESTWPKCKGQFVRLEGLAQSVRRHKSVVFVELSDGTTYKTIQLVLPPALAESIQNGAYVKIEGQVREGRKSYEVHVRRITHVGASDPEKSPIQKKAMSVDHLREHPHMRLRLPSYSLLHRVRAQAIKAMHTAETEYLQQMTYVQCPIVTSSDCEGAGETFTITPRLTPAANSAGKQEKSTHYFRTQKYLTVSSQLHLEAFSAALGDVWTLSPTFRAEQSDTSRHLSEFWMLEAEYRHVTTLQLLIEHVQRVIRHIVASITNSPLAAQLELLSEERGESAGTLTSRWKALLAQEWKLMTYTDAIELLRGLPDLPTKTTATWETGLQLEHEKALCEHFGGPVVVTNYPKAQKPFYMLVDEHCNPDQETVQCFDILVPGMGEIVGGSLREHRLENLIGNMREKGLLKRQGVVDNGYADEVGEHGADTENVGTAENSKEGLYPYLQPGESLNSLQWYADLRRFGSSPHGGFGLGFDRVLMYITGIDNVRDIVPFPRTWGVAHC